MFWKPPRLVLKTYWSVTARSCPGSRSAACAVTVPVSMAADTAMVAMVARAARRRVDVATDHSFGTDDGVRGFADP